MEKSADCMGVEDWVRWAQVVFPGEISGVWEGGEHYGCEEGTGEALELGLGGSGQAQDGCIGVCAEESADR